MDEAKLHPFLFFFLPYPEFEQVFVRTIEHIHIDFAIDAVHMATIGMLPESPRTFIL
jgi:hypothetical protein